MADVEDFIDAEGDYDVFDPQVAEAVEKESEASVAQSAEFIAAHLRRMKSAYVAVFEAGNPTRADLDFVMKDLFWFARGNVHYFTDARLQDVMAGRKQVLQRIAEYTRFDFDTLHKMYATTQQ